MSQWPETGRYRFDKSRSLARVFTFKEEGLLSPMAHDLELHTHDFDGTVEVTSDREARVDLRIDLWGLSVEHPLRGLQKREAEKTMQKKVLKDRNKARAELNATVTRGDGESHTVEGMLSLAGSGQRPLRATCTLSTSGESITVRTERIRLVQSEYGITPYKAMMGMLKLKDPIEVELEAVLVSA